MEWLERHQAAVREARESLVGLARKNRSLKARIRQLEEELERRGPRSAAGAWERERERLLQRVERLVADLERLLA